MFDDIDFDDLMDYNEYKLDHADDYNDLMSRPFYPDPEEEELD